MFQAPTLTLTASDSCSIAGSYPDPYSRLLDGISTTCATLEWNPNVTFTFRDARSEVVTSVTYEGAVNCADTKVSARA